MLNKPELLSALSDIHAIAKDRSEYLAMFPGTGLSIHALSGILNITTPLLYPEKDGIQESNVDQLSLI